MQKSKSTTKVSPSQSFYNSVNRPFTAYNFAKTNEKKIVTMGHDSTHTQSTRFKHNSIKQ